jgi:hypothetical protein
MRISTVHRPRRIAKGVRGHVGRDAPGRTTVVRRDRHRAQASTARRRLVKGARGQAAKVARDRMIVVRLDPHEEADPAGAYQIVLDAAR